MMLEGNPKYN